MDGFLGSGDLYIDRLTDDGQSSGYLSAGNAAKCEIGANAELKQLTGKGRTNYGQVLSTVSVQQPASLAITLNQIDKTNLAMAFLGDYETIAVTAGSVANEAVTALAAGKDLELSKRNITDGSVVVNRKDGENAADWEAATAYALGDFVVPTTPNGHYYQCTTAGTSDASEPTWPTDGSTVTDGTVVWTDVGVIEAVEDADYEINYRLGLFKILDGGDLIAGDELLVDFDYGAESGYKVKGSTKPTIKAMLMLDGKNLANGKTSIVKVYEAQLTPTSPVDFLSDEFTTLELTGTMITPDGYDQPFHVDQID